MGWHEGMWACIYKGLEMKRVNENVNNFLCMREEKSWNIEPNKTNSSLKTLNKKCNKNLSWNIKLKEIKSLYF